LGEKEEERESSTLFESEKMTVLEQSKSREALIVCRIAQASAVKTEVSGGSLWAM